MKKKQTNLDRYEGRWNKWWQVKFGEMDFEDTEWALDAEFDVDLDDVDTDYFNLKTA